MQNQWDNQMPDPKIPPEGGADRGSQQTYGKRLWHLWGPVFIKWGIGIMTSMAAVAVYSMLYVYMNYDVAAEALNNQEKMMNLSLKMSEGVMKYMTQIEGIAAAVTIPVMLILFHMDRKKEKLKGIAPNIKAPIWKYVGIIGISAAMCIGLNNLIAIGNLSQFSDSYEETAKAFYSAGFGIQILCLGILIPICEELVFRGLVFRRLREETAFLQAGLYSSAIFGVLHMNIVQMLYGFVVGMMLAYLYEKYGSLKAPVLAHVVMNVVSIFITKYKLLDWMMEDIIRIGSITVLCAAVSSLAFIWIQRIEERPEMGTEVI